MGICALLYDFKNFSIDFNQGTIGGNQRGYTRVRKASGLDLI